SLHNAGTEPALVSVSLLGRAGRSAPGALADLAIPPGRTVVAGLTAAAEEGPVTAVVEASRGEVVAAQTGVSDRGYAVVTGVPWASVSTG
ncbi:MAG TPA: hypothetical protein VG709_06155, partial [Actinomycetota bacterium]|nr:hypothetical protein [Actinomycetota bacterium]